MGLTEFPVWDGTGAAVQGGRWNEMGVPAIYTAGSQSLAMLERLVQRRRLRGALLVEANVPDDMAVADLFDRPPTDWDIEMSDSARVAGTAWLVANRSALLRVPSTVVRRECNYVVNPAHPECHRITVGNPEPLIWDERLFGLALT